MMTYKLIHHIPGTLAVFTSAVLLAAVSVASAQESFKSTDAAVDALVGAVKSGNQRTILRVLGRGASDIVSSGDPVDDATTRQRFLAAYDAKHSLSMEGDNKAVMILGQEDYPLPIPIVRDGDVWKFDVAAGREEILYRRIGRNELDTMQASLAYVDAQNEYAEKDRTGAGKGVYAQRILSRPGKKDGLYWPSEQGADESPLGELVAKATAQGYRTRGGPTPFHGYYYKILTEQGPAAPGGELDYVVKGKMIGGFALIAYPAEYRNSGVMTFIISHAGVLYQKDLGPKTTRLAKRLSWFNPDKTWEKVEPPPAAQ